MPTDGTSRADWDRGDQLITGALRAETGTIQCWRLGGNCCGRAGLGSASNRSDGSSGATAWLTPATGRIPEVRPLGRPVTEVGGVSPAKDRQRRHQGRNTLSNFNLRCPRSRGARVLTRPAVNLRHRRIAEDHCRFVACQCQASLR